MKGIVLAGGTGSRLYPLTKVTNKHLLPVYNKPMIYYPIEKLLEAGINEILVVTGIEHMGDMVELLGSGKEFGCSFTYKVQDEAGGIAEALGLARTFIGQDKMVVILGDNIFEENLSQYIHKFEKQKSGARLILKQVKDPTRFGVAEIKEDKIMKIQEKPKNPKSNYAVTGIYMYDNKVFEYINQCKPSRRGELEITDVNNFYIQNNDCFFDEAHGWWTDAGTFNSLRRANSLLEESLKETN